MTAFNSACEEGNIAQVKSLLTQNLSAKEYSAKNIWGENAFLAACKKGHLEIVKLLLKSEKTKDMVFWKEDDYPKHNPLDYACQNNHVEIAKILFKRYNDNLFHKLSKNECKSLLTLSVKNGSTDVVKWLLKVMDEKQYFIDLQTQNMLLGLACGNHIDMVKLLLPYNQNNLNEHSDTQQPVLHLATRSNNLEIVKLLLEQPKIDVLTKSINYGNVIWHICRDNEEGKILAEFLRRYSPAQNSSQTGHFTDIGLHEKWDNFTPFQIACKNDKRDNIKLLLASGHVDGLQELLDLFSQPDSKYLISPLTKYNSNQIAYIKKYQSGVIQAIVSLILIDARKNNHSLNAKDQCSEMLDNWCIANLSTTNDNTDAHAEFFNMINLTRNVIISELHSQFKTHYLSFAEDLFLTTVLIFDGYFRISANEIIPRVLPFSMNLRDKITSSPESQKTALLPEASSIPEPIVDPERLNLAQRFFSIITKLPMELQMITAYRLFGYSKNNIPSLQVKDAIQRWIENGYDKVPLQSPNSHFVKFHS